jgi:hypothetical protein
MKPLILAALAAIPLQPLAQSPAAPESLGVLVVGEPPAGPGADLSDLAGALRASIAARRFGVLTADELRRRMAGQGQGTTLTELDRAYAGAVASYQSGDYEGATRTLRAVVDDLERMPESDDAYAAWTRAMLRLARAEGSLGRKGEARDVMERLLRSNPGARADPELYPPSFARQLEEARTALHSAPQRKLQVTASAKNVRVFIEGRSAGTAPTTASLPPGRYRISGLLGDVRVSAGVVDLTQEDSSVAIDFQVASTFRPAAGPGLALPASGRARALVSAGASLKLDRVAAAALEKDGDVHYVVAGLYDIRRGILEREGRVRLAGASAPAGGMEALAGFLLTGQPSGLVITKGEKDDSAPQRLRLDLPEEPSPYKGEALKRWSPVAAGALAVGLGGVAIWQGVASNSKYDDAHALASGGSVAPSNVSAYNGLVEDGDSARRVSVITGVGAAACAVTSGVLGWLSYKQTGEIGPFRF